MLSILDLRRFLEPLRNKIYLLIGRGIITAYNNLEKTQKVQFKTLGDEVYEGIERMQEYGFETYPDTDAEEIHLSMGGNKDLSVVICVHDRRYRPKTLQPGEVCVYTKNDQHYIHLFANKDIEEKGKTLYLDFSGAVTIKSPHINVFGPNEQDTDEGGILLGGPSGHYKLVDQRILTWLYNHIHGHGDPYTSMPYDTPDPDSVLTQKTRAK